jgi:hypothetical protein
MISTGPIPYATNDLALRTQSYASLRHAVNGDQRRELVKMAEYLTTAEVAQLCRAPVETVRYWRHIGYGPQSFKVGRRVLYEAAEVTRWLNETQAAQAARA